jgi:inosine-uridine nucleoside N-ribohydrolase
MVYRASVATHRSVGLDVTFDMRLDAAEARQRLSGAPSALRDMTEAWFKKAPGIIFHDPLAAATIFDSQICRFERGQVQVELADERLRGATAWVPGGAEAPHEVALEAERTRFFEHYFAVVSSGFTP